MLNKLSLSLAEAELIAKESEKAAQKLKFSVSIAVVDCTTYLQVLHRMDGAPLMSTDGAYDKARSSAEGGHPTVFFEKPLNEGRTSMLKLPHTPIEGGVPVIVNGMCIGAVGVAGAPPHIDAEIANAGINAFLKTTGE